MKYFSIDLEMTGLDPRHHQILEFAAIFEDTTTQLCYKELPKFERILDHEILVGDPFALNMNSRLLKILAKLHSNELSRDEKKEYRLKHNIISPNRLSREFVEFANRFIESNTNGKITINVAGKNFGTLDWNFLEKIDNFKNTIQMSKRLLDPAMLYFDHGDNRLPNLSTCKERAGLSKAVSHKAIDDAWDVIELIRNGT